MDSEMDRKKDGMGSLSVDTRRVPTENAPVPDFCETPEDKSRLLAVPPIPLIYHKLPFFQRKTEVFSLFHPKNGESGGGLLENMFRKIGKNFFP